VRVIRCIYKCLCYWCHEGCKIRISFGVYSRHVIRSIYKCLCNACDEWYIRYGFRIYSRLVVGARDHIWHTLHRKFLWIRMSLCASITWCIHIYSRRVIRALCASITWCIHIYSRRVIRALCASITWCIPHELTQMSHVARELQYLYPFCVCHSGQQAQRCAGLQSKMSHAHSYK